MNKFLKQRKGITLISLVVTIIILIILAGITIGLVMGQDGLIQKAKETKPIQDIATAKEQLEMLKAPTKLNTYDVNLDNYLEELDRVKEEYEVNDVERINETNAEVVVGGKYKFLIKDKQNGDVEIIYQGEATELILSATSGTYIYPTSGTFEVVKNITGGELSVKSENENIAKVSISGTIVTVEPGTTTGTVEIIVTSAANGKYAEQKAVYLATVVNGEIELSATAYTGNYDGLPHNAITDVEAIPEDAKIEYSLDGSEYSTSVPTVTRAKQYTVSIRASKEGYTTKTISKTVTIGKAEAQNGNLVLSKTEGIITYPAQEKITVTKNISGGDLSIASSNEDVATASIDKLTGEITITPKAVSTDGQKVTITVTSSATANYAEQTATYEATINRGIIEIEATAYTGNYDETAHNAVTITKKSPSDVTIKYSIDGGAYSTTVPTVTGAKEYTVSIQASKAGYTTKTISKTVTVNKAPASSANLVLSATSGTLTYPTSGTFTVKTNTSGGTLSVTSSNTNIATASISGTTVTVTPGTTAGTATITVTSAATTNYEAQTAKYTATVKNGTITLEATAYTGNYDKVAHNAVTVTNKSPSDVTVKYSIDGGSYSTTVPTVTGANTYTVSIQASKAGYTTKTISKTVTVNKAPASSANLVLSATSGTLTYPTSGTFTVKTNTSGGTLSVSSSNTAIATATISGTTVTVKPGTTAGTATITVTSAATTNYEAQTAKYTATVKNGTITLEASAYTGNYDGAAHNAVTVTKKSPSDVTIKYSIDGGAYSTTVPTVTGAKEYTVSIQASKAGYTTKTISKTVTVNKAAANSAYLVLSATSGTLTYPTSGTFTVKTNTSGGALSVSSSNTAVATATISGTTVTVKPGTTAGTATITVTSAATTNYVAQTAKYTATVKNGTITLEATAYTGNYDGAAHNAVTITKKSPSDVTIKYSINGGEYNTTVPTVTGEGTYTISIQASKAGYTTKTISKTVTITKPSYTVTYNVDTSTSYKESVKKGNTCLSPTTFTPTKSGYTFVGWRENNTASATVLTTKEMGDSSINLYAVFSKKITATYNGNSNTGGSTTSSSGVLYYNNGNIQNASIVLAQNGFTKTDSTWIGWAQGSTSGTQYKNGDTVSLSSDTTFYAIWQGTTTIFDYTGGIQTFVAKAGVTYKLTVYGAQGGTGGQYAGGKGGYAYGNIKFNEDTTLYICVGGKGTSYGNTKGVLAGGYNGGGNGYWLIPSSSTSGRGAAGGGATHIGTFNSTLEDHGSKTGLLIVAGGGGGSGSIYGWNDSGSTVYKSYQAGTGGGTSGGNGTCYSGGYQYGGSQTAGGEPGNGGNAGSFGKGGNYQYYGAGGGGGLYGGAGAYWSSGAGGGSGYTDGCITGTTGMSNGVREGNGYAIIEIVGVGGTQHVHTGSASTGNGCYTVINYHSHTSSCNVTRGATNVGGSEVSTCSTCGKTYQRHDYYCSVCGASGSAQTSYCTCGAHPQYSWTHTTHTVIGCGKTAGTTIESYSLGCGYE